MDAQFQIGDNRFEYFKFAFMSSYSGVVKGKLSFKGDKSALKKRKVIADDERMTSDEVSQKTESSIEIRILPGTGRLTSSGTTVHGHYTEFMNQLSPGDAIIVNHPNTLVFNFLVFLQLFFVQITRRNQNCSYGIV